MKKKKKKKQRDSLTVRLVSLSFSLVDSNFFIFVCCGLLRDKRTSDGCGKVEAWGSAKVQRKSSESIQYQCVWTIFVYDKSLYIYVWVSLFRSSHLTFFLFNFPLEGRTRSSSGANALPFSSSPRVYPHASSPLLSLSLSLSLSLFTV